MANLKFKKISGFTQIELLVVIGIIVILGSIGTIIGFDAIARSSVNSERDLVVTLLTSARAKALANLNESAHGLRIETDKIIIFEGNSYADSDLNNHKTIKRNSSIKISGLTEVVFKQLAGNALSDGTIILTGESGSATIDINTAGLIDW